MKEKKSDIKIPLDFIEPSLELHIYGNKKDTLFEIDKELALENGESHYQILEGYFYNYYFKKGDATKLHYQLKENNVVKNSLRKDVSEGRISPNIYVGSLPLTVCCTLTQKKLVEINIEVLATKLDDNRIPTEDLGYRKNYQFMLKNIAEKCTELLMQINSPVNQNFEINFNKDNKTIYQRFAFVNALINTNEFNEAVQRIISSPTSKWREENDLKDIRSIRRLSSSAIRQIASRSNRVKLSNPIGKLSDIPTKIESSYKVESTDTHENRFIKHALEVFRQFCIECRISFLDNGYTKSRIEAEALIVKLDNHLNQPFFKEIDRPTTLKLNSPALQRKSGYRELLNAWLQYDLAAKLIWKGGDDVYKAGKRDIAVLYEYWLFFVLYDLIKSKFNLDKGNESYTHLIEETKDGLNVMVKSGKLTALEGTYTSKVGRNSSEGRKLHVKFSYNRTFEGGTKYSDRKAGSWTKPLRPDYTLSIWPEEIKDEEIAELEEKIIHIHFDSKYKVQQFTIKTDVEENLTETDENSNEEISELKIDSLEKEKNEERKGKYKNADLLKMHAYKDAIRRTGGAYVLYPGNNNEKATFQGFHELIPGLGAFAISPKEGENGTSELSDFIDKIIDHFNNMASQQRRHSNNIFKIYNDPLINVKEPMPEYIIPDETHVIIAYYKSKDHLSWIQDRMRYNGRIGNVKGAMNLTPEFIGANYLILHNKSNPDLIIYKIDQNENKKPFVISSKDAVFNSKTPKYPNSSQPFYLIFNLIEKEDGFLNGEYNISKLPGFSDEKEALPFTCSLIDLLSLGKVD